MKKEPIMKHVATATAALALLAGAAVAQTSPSQPGASTSPPAAPTSPPTTGSTDAANITPQEEAAIKDYIAKDAKPSTPAPSGFTAAEGATVPQTIIVYQIPAGVAGGPGMTYAVVGSTAFVIDPQRKIVEIIEWIRDRPETRIRSRPPLEVAAKVMLAGGMRRLAENIRFEPPHEVRAVHLHGFGAEVAGGPRSTTQGKNNAFAQTLSLVQRP
jgi:hypothetical protein